MKHFKPMSRNYLICLLLIFAVPGCSPRERTSQEEVPTARSEISEPGQRPEKPIDSDKPLPASEDDPVVAEFGADGMVRLSAVLAFTSRQEENVMPIRPGDTEGSLIKDLRLRKLDALLDEELTYRKAKREGIELPKESLDGMVQEMIDKQYEGSRESLEESLTAKNMDIERLREALERRFLVTELIRRRVTQLAKVDEDELETYYQENIDSKFTVPDTYHVHFLEIQAEEEALRAECRQEIEALRTEIVEKIRDIETIPAKVALVTDFCRKHSQDANSQGGSYWVVFGRIGPIDPAMEMAAEEAKEGEFGPIMELETRPGYVTAFKRSGKASYVKPFNEQTKEEIRRILYKERRDNVMENLKEEIRADMNVRLYKENLFQGLS